MTVRKLIIGIDGVLMEISVKQKVMTCVTGLWCVVVVMLVLGHNANADEKRPNDVNKPPEAKSDSATLDANDANELLRTKWDAIVMVLQNKDISEEAKTDEIDRILAPMFDFALMAKLTLGEKHWPKLNEHQREEFTRLFVDKLKTTYRDTMSLYTNEVAVFKPPVEARKGTIWIPMELVSEGKKVELLYKLRKADNRWKIYDVEIEGVSVLLTYRSQFDDILSRGTVEDLLARLAEKQPAK
jgi:phospholipid transport system substrate-binding protein